MTEAERTTLPARGPGEDLFDAPSEFFLSHRARIEAWAELGPRVEGQVAEWYRHTVADRLEAVGKEREMTLYDLADTGDHRSLTLARPGWIGTSASLSIGLGWNEGSALQPFTLVRAREPATWEAFLREVGDTPKDLGFSSERWWSPVYRYPSVPNRWWTDLQGFADLLVDQVVSTVERFEPAVEATLAGLPGAGDRDKPACDVPASGP